ncbi:MAG: PilZ domain-containing protein [Candidatus Omnitrophica bacterium]|nr:PilZ domain-containing protein [Candidatus Omnitrophota bacterium]MCB9719868.1 PilZ domain-containing protein [Candidatus Omnitrophota bacterium]
MNEEIRKDDRRLFERFSARYPARFKDEREDFGEKIYLRDASAFGARLSGRDRLFLNDKISIEVDLPDGMAPMDLKGEVVWISKNAQSAWDFGIRFHKIELLRLARLYKFHVNSLPA